MFTMPNNFWDIKGYKRLINKIENRFDLAKDLMVMLEKRAEIERRYAKDLENWKEDWTSQKTKPSDKSITHAKWNSLLETGVNTASLHRKLNEDIILKLVIPLATWISEKKEKKILKNFDDQFVKAQKIWKDEMDLFELHNDKQFDASDKLIESKKSHEKIMKNPKKTARNRDNADIQLKKKEIKSETAKAECLKKLNDLEEKEQQYRESMKEVYKKVEEFEKERLKKFGEIFNKFNKILSEHYTRETYEGMIQEFSKSLGTDSEDHSEEELEKLRNKYGPGMTLNLPKLK